MGRKDRRKHCRSRENQWGVETGSDTFGERPGLAFVELGKLPACSVLLAEFFSSAKWEPTNRVENNGWEQVLRPPPPPQGSPLARALPFTLWISLRRQPSSLYPVRPASSAPHIAPPSVVIHQRATWMKKPTFWGPRTFHISFPRLPIYSVPPSFKSNRRQITPLESLRRTASFFVQTQWSYVCFSLNILSKSTHDRNKNINMAT